MRVSPIPNPKRSLWMSGVLLCLAGQALASPFTETSTTSAGALPIAVTPTGGIVVDLLGANGNRVVGQLTANSLAGSANYNFSPVTLGNFAGFNDSITSGLGGGISELAIRITASDWDNAAGELDFNANIVRLNGINFGNPSDFIAQATNDAGVVSGSGQSAGGFRNNLLDTGWLLNTDPTTLAAILTAIDAADGINFDYTDTSANGNVIDFSRGVDALGGGFVIGPVLFATLENTAQTPTQREVGRALDAQLGAGNALETVRDTILALPTADDRRAALDALAGRITFMAGDNAIAAAEVQGVNIDSRLNALRRGDSRSQGGISLASAASGLASQDAVTHYVSQNTWNASDNDTATDAAPRMPFAGMPGAWPDETAGVFLLGSATISDTDASDSQLASELLFTGVTLGLDRRIDDRTVVGIALGISENDTDFDDGSDFKANNHSLTVYATRSLPDDLYLDLAAGVSVADIETRRRIVIPGTDDTALGETDGVAFTGSARLVKEISRGEWVFSPETSLRFTEAIISDYTESGGGALGMAYEDQHARTLVWNLGVNTRRTWQLDDVGLTPYAGIAMEAELLDESRSIATVFNGDPGTSFDTFTENPDSLYGRASLGFTAQFDHDLSIYADYSTLFAHSDTEAHTFSLGVRLGF